MKIVTSPYIRSHLEDPRGRGYWAFQASKTAMAHDCDLFGEVFWFKGTYAEAKRQAKLKTGAACEYLAVLP